MKNIMIVDGADNCGFDIFQTTDELFDFIFPGEDQNIEFISDVFERGISSKTDELFSEMWKHPVKKSEVCGIHGILFYEQDHRKKFYPNKKDSDLDGIGRNSP